MRNPTPPELQSFIGALPTEGLQALSGLLDATDLPLARWDVAGRLLFCNRPYAEQLGRPAAELPGRTLAELFGDAAWQVARAAFVQARAGRTASYEHERPLVAAAGEPRPARWVRVLLWPERHAGRPVETIWSVAVDIHDEVTARAALEATRRRLDRFTDNIPNPLTYVDTDFVLRFVNKAYCEVVGQPASALLGRPIGAVRGSVRWAQHRPYFEKALAGTAVQYTRLVDNLPRGARWLRTSYVPDRDDDDRVCGVYTVTIDVHDLTVAQQRLLASAERDPLTNVYSRRALMERLDAAVAAASTAPVALYFIDLDGFKQVNDVLGHSSGDALLVAVAGALRGAVRDTDTVGRFGGDEFLVIAGVSDATGAHVLAQHLLQSVRAACAVVTVPTSASIGYALAPSDATQPLRLVQCADAAMYHAKRDGRDRTQHAGAIAAPPGGG